MDNLNEEMIIDYCFDDDPGKDPLEMEEVEKKPPLLPEQDTGKSINAAGSSAPVETKGYKETGIPKNLSEEEKKAAYAKLAENRRKQRHEAAKRLEQLPEEKQKEILAAKRVKQNAKPFEELSEEKKAEFLAAKRLQHKQTRAKRRANLSQEAKERILVKSRERYAERRNEILAARRQRYGTFKIKKQKEPTDQSLEADLTRKELAEQKRFQHVMNQYLYRSAKRAVATEEDKIKARTKSYMSRMAKRMQETPEQREQRLQKHRDAYLAKRLSMTPQEQQEYREGVRVNQRKYGYCPSLKPYSAWSEESKEKMRARQREKTKNETPEQRQARLKRMKVNTMRKKEISKIMEMDISRDEAVGRLKILRPDLYVNFKTQREKGRQCFDINVPYVPRILNYRPVCRRGKPPSVKLTEQDILAYIAEKEAKGLKTKPWAPELTKSNESNQLEIEPSTIQGDSAITIDSQQELISSPVAEEINTTKNSMSPEKTIATQENNKNLQLIPDDDTTPQRLDDDEHSTHALSPFHNEDDENNEIVNEDQTQESIVDNNICSQSPVQSENVNCEDIPKANDIPTQIDENVQIETPHIPDLQTSIVSTTKKTPVTHAPFICDTCGKKYRSKDFFNRHIQLEALLQSKSQVFFTCPEVSCGKVFVQSFKLLRHYNICHELKTDTTPEIFPRNRYSYEGNEKYRQVCNNLTDLVCPFCKQEYREKNNLKRHIRNIHGAEVGMAREGPFICDQCPKQYKNKDTLSEHVRRDHMGMENKCDICNRHFQTAFKLCKHKIDVHQQTLDPSTIPKHVTTFQCDYCGEVLIGTSKTQWAHVKSAHPEKLEEFKPKSSRNPSVTQIQCPLCDASFHYSSLRRHMKRFHSGSVPNKILPQVACADDSDNQSVCVKCHKKCRNNHNLTVHIMANHGKILGHGLFIRSQATSRVCFFCKETLADFRLFKLHMLSRHVEEFIQLFRQTWQDMVQCPYCDVKHRNQRALATHIVHRHKEQHAKTNDVKRKRKLEKSGSPESSTSKMEAEACIETKGDLESSSRYKCKNQRNWKLSQRKGKESAREKESVSQESRSCSPVRKSSRVKKRSVRYIESSREQSSNSNNKNKSIISNSNEGIGFENRVKDIDKKLSKSDKSVLQKFSDPKLIRIPVVKLGIINNSS